MTGILLTQYSGAILGPICKYILGPIMNVIFKLLDVIRIPNVGIAIILFTIVIYLCLTPLTFKQQKFSKLNSLMAPEIQEIQAKYKNKKDQASMTMMQQETQAVYAKYGVSPTGSCVQLLIQMPILFALYRVIYSIPAYVQQVKDAYFPFVDKLVAEAESAEFIQNFTNANMFAKQFTNENFINNVGSYVSNTYIDVLNRASTADWLSLKVEYPNLIPDIDNTLNLLNKYNNFLGINIGNSPWDTMKTAFASQSYLILIGALLIPVLAAVTQWINTKLIPTQQSTGNDQADQMANSMKTMNTLMPLMSAWFCFTLPAGMGIYWITGAVVRSIQQVITNKYIDKLDFDEIIEKNKEKAAKKMEKQGQRLEKMQEYASISTRNIDINKTSGMSEKEREEALRAAEERYRNSKPGSMASKANLVRDYNEKNNRK